MNELGQRLKKGITRMQKILKELKIKLVKLIGRVKSKESIKAKQKNAYEKTQLSDLIGIRVIFKTKKELNKVYNELIEKENIVFIKDYVNNPRKDGLILKTNPKESYQSYHVFTDSLNKVLTELQLRTIKMEENRLKLAQKYGEEYWKTKEFRKNKYKLGDSR